MELLKHAMPAHCFSIGGPGKEGWVFGQFLDHIAHELLTGLEKISKTPEKAKLIRRRRRHIPQRSV
uniref:Bm9543 n=1 Tax=Brugia malayi TaxID=6279 RepID=A0A1I9GF18_BRUMA|nr:Bm9543 [Brugia malayi]